MNCERDVRVITVMPGEVSLTFVEYFRKCVTFRQVLLTLHEMNLFYVIYRNSVRTSQETHYISTAKTNWLMLFRKKIAAVKNI
jgi:hypothetical protein